MRFIVRTALMMAAAWLTFSIVSGLTFDGEWWDLLIVAILIGLANAVVIPIIKLVSLPLRILTLGIFTLVINIGVIVLILWMSESIDLGVHSDGWGWTILGALMITVLSSIISWLVKD